MKFQKNVKKTAETLKFAEMRGGTLGLLMTDPNYKNSVSVFAKKMGEGLFTKIGSLGVDYKFSESLSAEVIGKHLKVGEILPVFLTVNLKSYPAETHNRVLISISGTAVKFSDDKLRECFDGQTIIDFKAERFIEDKSIPGLKARDLEAQVEKEMEFVWKKSQKVESGVNPNLNGNSWGTSYSSGTVDLRTIPTTADGTVGLVYQDGNIRYTGNIYTDRELCGTIDNHNGILNKENNKKEKPMKNMSNMFNKFGNGFNYPISNFAISMFGGLAVKQNGTFVTYDVKKGEAMDVMDFVMEGFEDMIMIMPAQSLVKGDIFVQDNKVYQMIDTKENKAYCYTDGTIETLVNKSNIMGFKMYAKVFNLMGNMNMNMGGATGEAGAGNMFANPMFMMMMMKDGDSGSGMGDMMKMMMMSQMFSQNGLVEKNSTEE